MDEKSTKIEEEFLRIGKKLEKMIQGTKSMDSAMELLEALSGLPIDINILTKTRIGLTLNDLRKKAKDEKIAKRAKQLIKGWKTKIDRLSSTDSKSVLPRNDSSASNLANGASGDGTSHSPNDNSAHAAHGNGTSVQKKTPKPAPAPQSSQHNTNNNYKATKKQLNKDEVRNKCATMILDALVSKDLPDGTLDPETLAVRIEQELFEVHRGTSEKYRAALRSRVFNLRDKKNPALRENVLIGAVSPEKFAVMTAEEMASDEMKAQRERFTQQAIEGYQMSIQEGTPSDMFKCGKCGQNNCTYTQVQTRSADEPMTTFVFCRTCGNRWKFC